MGGRRKSNIIQKKEKPLTVKTIFDCRLCGYENCVQVKIKRSKFADVLCQKCGTFWECNNVRAMDENIDIYHKWIIYLSSQKKKPAPGPLPLFNDQISQSNSIEDIERIVKAKKKQDESHSLNLSDESIQVSSESEREGNTNKYNKVKDLPKIKQEIIKQEYIKYKKPQSPVKQPLTSDEDDEDSLLDSDDDDHQQPIKKIKME